MKIENQCLAAALAAFPYEGKITALEPFGSGHINDTYAVYIQNRPKPKIGYILQRLNTNVFKKPQEVMQNIMGVTEYLKSEMEKEGTYSCRCTLHFLKTIEDQPAFYDQQGMPWRSYIFIENSFCYDKSPTPEVFYESACAFGNFLRLLQNYPAETLHETIPHFHDTRKRLDDLKLAIEQDSFDRVKNCQPEIDFVLERTQDCSLLVDMLEKGELPLRVTHNDTKLNNVLFDETTKEAICVIDLDTIMPGLSLNDYGDSIRFGATDASEDEQDLSKVNFNLDLYDIYTKGFLETAGAALTANEKAMLPQGARIITLECGIRFLTDYLNGDTYFKTDRVNHNLDRSRTQFKLVSDMEQVFDQMQQIVEKYSH